MKYLTIFDINHLHSATGFNSKADAAKYIKECAAAAKTKALENVETSTYILTMPDGQEMTARIESVDTTVKYQLIYDRNHEHVETSYHATRAALVKAAEKIVDQLDFVATPEENARAIWHIQNTEENFSASLGGKLVLVGSANDNIIESYQCYDMIAFCKNYAREIQLLTAVDHASKTSTIASARKKGLTNLLLGLGIAAVGGILSLISYHNAKAGESYTVYTGIIAIGVVDACIGIYYLINPKAALPKDERKK